MGKHSLSFCFGDDMAREFAKAFYRSKEWKETREYVLKRDNYLCQHCGELAEEVHHKIHLTPFNITDASISLGADNLVSLCKNCHSIEHNETIKQANDGFLFVDGLLTPIDKHMS